MTQTLARRTRFRHAALLYAGEEEFVEKTGAFLDEGLANDEAMLVVVSARKIELLLEHLGTRSDRVLFADMAAVGRNPARIIAVWREFVDTHGDAAGMRGVGEPIDASRDADALVECERHEALLNIAFDGGPAWPLLCPYDTDALAPRVIDEALRNHPYLHDGDTRPNASFRGLADCAHPLDKALSDPPPDALTLRVDLARLAELRRLSARVAADNGFTGQEAEDFVLTVHELATNSIRYGGGSGAVRLWAEGGDVVAEVHDRGRILDPLVGRVEPRPDLRGGRGLWLANQLADLVQIRVHPEGGTVRARMRKRETTFPESSRRA